MELGCRQRQLVGIHGPLAQLAEQVTLNHPVPGSSPGGLTKGWRHAVGPNRRGEVSELVDEHDLGSCAARRRSSSLLFPTTSQTAGPKAAESNRSAAQVAP